MSHVKMVPAERLIDKISNDLKENKSIVPPEWSYYVKTGAHKERAPMNPDWWYIRAASILRKVAIKGPIGVSDLRKIYGGKKNRGVKPEKFYKASGKIIRTILQQLEQLQLVKKTPKGRVITDKGRQYIDKMVDEIIREELPELKKYVYG